MPIFDNNGTTNAEISKVYDNDGIASHPISKIYDSDGTATHLLYSAWEVGVLTVDGFIAEELGGLTVTQYPENAITLTTDGGCIYTRIAQKNGQNTSATVGFTNPVDVTNYNTLYALVDYEISAWSRGNTLCLGTNRGGNDMGTSHGFNLCYDGAPTLRETQLKISIDISNRKGNAYVSWSGGTSPNALWFKHYKIWME